MSSIDEEMRFFVSECESKKYTQKKICNELAEKFPKEYEETKLHWENKKRDARKKNLLHDDFKYFLPVLKRLGFKPGSTYQIDQIHPGFGYSLGNTRWLNVLQNSQNKLAAPHNQHLAIGEDVQLFEHWYDVLAFYKPNIKPLSPNAKTLKAIRDDVLFQISYSYARQLMEFTIEKWGEGSGWGHYERCNYEYGSHLPSEPTLSQFIKYLEAINSYFGALLNTYKGQWESKRDKETRVYALKLQMQKDYEAFEKQSALDLSAHKKLGEHSPCLRIALALDLLPNPPIPLQEFLAELTSEYGLTKEEYQAVKFMFLHEEDESKEQRLDAFLQKYIEIHNQESDS